MLEINIYNGKSPNAFTFYEDDGKTYNFENGEYCRRIITFDPANKSIVLGKADGSFPSKFTSYRMVLHGFGDIMGVKVNGADKSLKLRTTKQRFFESDLTNDNIEIKY